MIWIIKSFFLNIEVDLEYYVNKNLNYDPNYIYYSSQLYN